MHTRHLGNSDLEITPIGIGAWAMGGGDWAFSWGRQEDKESIAAIHAALDAGVNWIDTAAVYGLGHSEEVVGKAIEGRAHRPYVFTKCSLVWDDQRLSLMQNGLASLWCRTRRTSLCQDCLISASTRSGRRHCNRSN